MTINSEIRIKERDVHLRDRFGKHSDWHRYHVGDPRSQVQLAELQAYWDPGSAGEDQDRSVLRVVGRTFTDEVYVFEAVELSPMPTGRTLEDGSVVEVGRINKQLEQIPDVLERYHLNAVAVESDMLKVIPDKLKEAARRRNRKLTIHAVLNAGRQSKRKEVRIEDAFEPLMLARTLYVADKIKSCGHFLEELRTFPQGEHDDNLDRIAGAIARLSFRYKSAGGPADPMRLRRPIRSVPGQRYNPFGGNQ